MTFLQKVNSIFSYFPHQGPRWKDALRYFWWKPSPSFGNLFLLIVFNYFSSVFIGWPVIWKHFLPQKSEVPPDYDKHNPEQKQIYRFVRTLFSAAQLTAECAIVTLVSAFPWPQPLSRWLEWVQTGSLTRYPRETTSSPSRLSPPPPRESTEWISQKGSVKSVPPSPPKISCKITFKTNECWNIKCT